MYWQSGHFSICSILGLVICAFCAHGQVSHIPTPLQVCNLLHHFLLKAFPEQYEARAEETRGETQCPCAASITLGCVTSAEHKHASTCLLTHMADNAEIEGDEGVTSVEVNMPAVFEENEWAQASIP